MRFRQLAIDNSQTEYDLQLLDATYKKEVWTYHQATAKYRADNLELRELESKTNLSDYEEGKRRMRMLELKERIRTNVPPETVNHELYKIRLERLLNQLRETAFVNASLLIWQAKGSEN
ncbi:hypothetical protein GCM10027592_58570 [Spirosoma flavus]